MQRTQIFLTYPKFIQTILNAELTDLPVSDGIYLPLSHTKKVFSNMKRVGKGFSNTVTPLFSTMMGVTHTQGEGSRSQPTSRTTPIDPQPSPTTSNIPQSPIHKAQSTPLKTYKKSKAKKVPSSLESSPTQPQSPPVEHSPQENTQREPKGQYPKSKKVVHKERGDHLERAYTTIEAQSDQQESIKSIKT